jgi:hypothetical protein
MKKIKINPKKIKITIKTIPKIIPKINPPPKIL